MKQYFQFENGFRTNIVRNSSQALEYELDMISCHAQYFERNLKSIRVPRTRDQIYQRV